MAEKRYYWLKLKEDYFTNPKIKKLRKIAGGDTFTIIYLKMQLLSISNSGVIEFEGIEPTFEEELALKLDEDLENVQLTLAYLKTQCLIETNNNEYLLVDACKNIGSECDSAKRVRDFREKQKVLQCNEGVTPMLQNSISISNSKSISKSNNINKEDILNEFEELWKIYPNKQGKTNAFKSYDKARKKGVEFETIKKGLENYIDYCKVKKMEKQYIKHGSTWFNQECWNDEYNLKGDNYGNKPKLPDWVKVY